MRSLGFALIGLAVAVLLATLVSPFASSSPDGLERIAEDQGFIDRASDRPAWQHSLAPDYALPVVKHEGASTAMAGLAGTLLTFGAGWLLAKAAARRSRSRRDAPEDRS